MQFASIVAGVTGLTFFACKPNDGASSTAAGASQAALPSRETVTESSVPPAPGASVGGSSEAQAGNRRRVVINDVDLTGVGYDRGSPDAPIVMVDFSDFGCPYCGRHARETQPALDKEFVAPGKVFYKYVPFVMGMFPNGDLAARAAECAADQGRFWEMHDAIYADQQAWKRGSEPGSVFKRYAVATGMNATQFDACYKEDRGAARTRRANEAAGRLGIRATPTFFVDGRAIEGALPLEQFRSVFLGIAQ